MPRIIALLLWLLAGAPVSAVTLEQFGGGWNVTDNSTAWEAMMEAIPNGGVVDLGCVRYGFSAPITVHSHVQVRGCGDTTVIDCAAIAQATACVSVVGIRQRLEHFVVRGQSSVGVLVYNSAFVELESIGVQDNRAPDGTPWDDNCIQVSNSWRVSIEDARLIGCRTHGISAGGYGTTLMVRGGYAEHTGKSGAFLNSLAYFHFDNFAVDFAADYAVQARNVVAGKFTAQGGEFNEDGMFLFEASDAIAGTATVKDVKGIVIEAPFSYGNGQAGANDASLVEAVSSNGRTIDITIIGGYEHTSPSGKSIIASGTGVRISRTGGSLKGTTNASGGAVVTTLF